MDLLAVKVVLKTTSKFQSKHTPYWPDNHQIETPENGMFAIVLF